MRKIIFILITILSLQVSAQQQVSGNLLTYFDNIINNIPRGQGSDEYQKPSTDQLNIFRNVISGIINENYSGANSSAEGIGYKITQFLDDTGITYYILESNSSNLWGTFIFNPASVRSKLVIQSPHAIYDSYTGTQGILVYRVTGSFAFFMNGTHRCNSSLYSVCDGTTTACSNGGPATRYRASDQAHNTDNTFQAATEILENEIDSLIYIQLHGFSKGSGDPYLIMSGGTSIPPQGPDYIALLRDALLNVDGGLTFKIAHLDTDWTRLIATSNTQGRLINGSSNPCSIGANQNSGRFIHIEQEKSRLRDSDTDRMKMATAINAVFPPNNVTAIEEYCEAKPGNNLEFYPNPFNSMTNIVFSINEASEVQLYLYDVLGRRIKTLFNGFAASGSNKVNLHSNNLGSGIYFIVLISKEGTVTRKVTHLK